MAKRPQQGSADEVHSLAVFVPPEATKRAALRALAGTAMLSPAPERERAQMPAKAARHRVLGFAEPELDLHLRDKLMTLLSFSRGSQTRQCAC